VANRLQAALTVRSSTLSSRAYWMSPIRTRPCAGDLDSVGSDGAKSSVPSRWWSGGIHHFHGAPLRAGSHVVEDLGQLPNSVPRLSKRSSTACKKEAANRSVDELNRERDAMLLELLATRAKAKRRRKQLSPEPCD